VNINLNHRNRHNHLFHPLQASRISLTIHKSTNMSTHGQGGPAGDEKINTDIVTLTRHLNEEQTKHSEATGDFTYV
jgi:hypothetical protein